MPGASSMSPSDQRSTARLERSTRPVASSRQTMCGSASAVSSHSSFARRMRFVDVFWPLLAAAGPAARSAGRFRTRGGFPCVSVDRGRRQREQQDPGGRRADRHRDAEDRRTARSRPARAGTGSRTASPATRMTVSGLRAQSAMKEPGCSARSTDTINVDGAAGREDPHDRADRLDVQHGNAGAGQELRKSAKRPRRTSVTGSASAATRRATTCSAALPAATGVSVIPAGELRSPAASPPALG